MPITQRCEKNPTLILGLGGGARHGRYWSDRMRVQLPINEIGHPLHVK